VLAQSDVDGVVISHGTDTLEETAYWLHLTVRHAKPVVLVAAMRPSTALSADGPLNLLNAVTVAADAGAAGKGVLVVLANRIHSARDVTKTSTYAVDAFQSPDVGQLGWVQDGRVEFLRAPLRAHTTASEFSGGSAGGLAVVSARDRDAANGCAPASHESQRGLSGTGQAPLAERAVLPSVEILLSYAGVTRTAVDALVAAGVHGLVVAGTGNGSLHATLQHALADAVGRGVVVVRASRVGCGHVMHDAAAPDAALGFVSAGSLNPYKARVLLMLALAGGLSCAADVQRVFDTY
jgi:L-asparaginase